MTGLVMVPPATHVEPLVTSMGTSSMPLSKANPRPCAFLMSCRVACLKWHEGPIRRWCGVLHLGKAPSTAHQAAHLNDTHATPSARRTSPPQASKPLATSQPHPDARANIVALCAQLLHQAAPRLACAARHKHGRDGLCCRGQRQPHWSQNDGCSATKQQGAAAGIDCCAGRGVGLGFVG